MKIMKTFNLTTTIVAVIGFFQPDGVHGNTMRVTSFVAGEQRTQSSEKVVNGNTVFRGSTSPERKLVKNAKKNAVVHAPTPPSSSPSGNCKHVTVRTNHQIACVFRWGKSNCIGAVAIAVATAAATAAAGVSYSSLLSSSIKASASSSNKAAASCSCSRSRSVSSSASIKA